MSRSAGPGSPIHFKCHRGREYFANDYALEREQRERHKEIKLTGRWRRPRPRPYHALGVRSSYFHIEYRCQCGHVGWTNHIDLAIRATHEGVIPPDRAVEDYKLKSYVTLPTRTKSR